MEEENSQITEPSGQQKLSQIRNELKNIRTQHSALKMHLKRELGNIQRQLSDIESGTSAQRFSRSIVLSSAVTQREPIYIQERENTTVFQFEPIGYVESVYKQKNGIPRQPGICQGTRSKLAISRQIFSNPHHLLHGLDGFSHVWIIFVFHKNKDGFSATKVRPPRLNGAKVGVFATRSPHRPNAVGLTLAQIDKIEDNVVHFLGTDILDGTPVIDIKPYIPEYDSVFPPSSLPPENLSKNCGSFPPFSDAAAAAALTNSIGEELNYEQQPQPEKDGVPNHSVVAEAAELGTAADKEDDPLQTGCDKHKDGGQQKQIHCNFPAGQKCSYNENSDENSEWTEGHGDPKNSEWTEGHGDPKNSEWTEGHGDPKNSEWTEGHGDPNLPTCSTSSKTGAFNSSVAIGRSVQVAEWIHNPPTHQLTVLFTPRAAKDLDRFSSEAIDSNYRLCNFRTIRDLLNALESILSADPRSVYRRKRCSDRLYYLTLDCVHVTCWFDGNTVEVVKICPVNASNRTHDHSE